LPGPGGFSVSEGGSPERRARCLCPGLHRPQGRSALARGPRRCPRRHGRARAPLGTGRRRGRRRRRAHRHPARTLGERPPRVWQLALLAPSRDGPGSRALYEAGVEIERLTAATIVSLSRHTAVYKLRGVGDQLPRYFADLGDPRFATSMAFGHNRYATNTSTSFDRVQPFAVFAHNGEINTI